MNYKSYLYSLKVFIIISFLVFALATLNGYFSAQSSPQEMKLVLEKVRGAYQSVMEMSPWQQFFFVVINNGFTLFLILLLGAAFGIFPFLVLLSNGSILGTAAYFVQQELAWSTFFLGTLPHGIIEIPVLLLAGAIGLKLGKRAFGKIFKKEEGFGAEFISALKFFLRILLPLLVAAAAIEIFLTAQFLK